MAKNDFLARQRAMQQGFLDVGEQMGMQKMWDYVQIALRDPDVMGRDTFGAERLERIYEALKTIADVYHTAFTDDKEADYYQEKMDQQLREVWGDKFFPFAERYPYIKQQDYLKAKKNWR